jgi:hypothetical protein
MPGAGVAVGRAAAFGYPSWRTVREVLTGGVTGKTRPLGRVTLACLLVAVGWLLFVGAPAAVALLGFSASQASCGAGAAGIAVGDLNRDRRLDIVTVNATSNTVSVLLGRGAGTFRPQHRYATGQKPIAVAVADLDHDGRPDVVTANALSGTVSVLLARGDGSLKPARAFVAGRSPAGLAVADVNKDGRPDLVVTNDGADTVSVLLGRGDGTFSKRAKFAAGSDPRGVVVRDFNGDGRPDIAVADHSAEAVSVLQGRAGGFRNAVAYPVSTEWPGLKPKSLAAGDLNADGHPDLIIANDYQGCTSTLIGDGDGAFAPGPAAVWGDAAAATLADVTGDGTLDIVTASGMSAAISVSPGSGTGRFCLPQRYDALRAWVGSATSLVCADFNGDGRRDVAAADGAKSRVCIFINTGVGSFRALSPLDVPCQRESGFTTADFDDDGNLDVAGGIISVAFGRGDGTVGDVVTPTEEQSTRDMLAIDLNGDHLPDIAFAGYGGVGVILNTGDRTFAAPVVYGPGTEPTSLAAADLDGDGDIDLVTTYSDSVTSLGVRLNDGHGGFGLETTYGAAGVPVDVTIADMTEDGVPDVVTVIDGFDRVSIFAGIGDGTLGARTDSPAGAGSTQVAVADYNGDGHLDVGTDAISVMLGVGDGSLREPCTTASDGPFVSGDFNGDGRPDLASAVWAGSNGDEAHIFLGKGDGTFVEHVTNGTEGALYAADVDGDGNLDLLSLPTAGGACAMLGTGDYPSLPKLVLGGGRSWVNTRSFDAALSARLAATLRYRLNGGPWSEPEPFVPTKEIGVVNDGKYNVDVAYTDPLGVETVVSGQIGVDTWPPTPVADWPTTVHTGRTATIRYRVDDMSTGSPTASVWISIRDGNGREVKLLTLGQRKVNTDLSCSFVCRLTPGLYTFKVEATDLAGNWGGTDAYNTLRVK